VQQQKGEDCDEHSERDAYKELQRLWDMKSRQLEAARGRFL
jgi:hypothetical protein